MTEIRKPRPIYDPMNPNWVERAVETPKERVRRATIQMLTRTKGADCAIQEVCTYVDLGIVDDLEAAQLVHLIEISQCATS